MAEEDGFLSRWSKRKRAVAEEAKAIPVSAPALPEPVVEEAEPEFDISTLPSLGELTGTSDMSVFLQKGVPEALKNAALRRAWALDPFIRDYVGPVECGWDFNDPTSMPGFGPLEDSVDRTEMLRQILEGGRREPAGEGEAAGEAALVSEEPADSIPPRATSVAEGRITSDEGENCGPDDAALQNDVPVFIDEIPPEPRRRRHGGAVPG